MEHLQISSIGLLTFIHGLYPYPVRWSTSVEFFFSWRRLFICGLHANKYRNRFNRLIQFIGEIFICRWSYERVAFCRLTNAHASNRFDIFIDCVDRTKNYAKVYTELLILIIELPSAITQIPLHSSRKPFQLKPLLLAYNLAIALLNLYIGFELLLNSFYLQYNYFCEPCREMYSPEELRVNIINFSFKSV